MDYNKLFRNIPEAIVIISPDYIIMDASDRYLQITMRTREQLIGLHFLLEAFPDIAHTYEDNPVRKILDKASLSKKTEYLEVLRYDLARPEKDGGGFEIRYWEAVHTPMLDAEGNLEYLIQRSTDVTDRELARQALSESEEKFRFMAEAMPQLIFTSDAEGKPAYFNQRWTKLTGISLDAFLSKGWTHAVHPDDLPSINAAIQKALAAGTEIQFEYRLKEKDGSYRWYLNHALPMLDDTGNIRMWISSSTDVDDTRKMVQELLDANEQMALLSDQVQAAFSKAENERQTMERLMMQAPAMFCVLKGPEHRFELVNKQYQQKLFPNRALLNRTVADALPEVIDQGFINLLDDVYNTGKEFVAEEVLVKLDRHDNGQLEDVYMTFIYQPIYEQEQIVGILVFAYEVTQQVIYKMKLQQLGQA